MVRPCIAKELVDLADVALHQCIRPLFWLRTITDIGARAISLADRPQWAIIKVRDAGKTDPPFSPHPLADLGGLEGLACVIMHSLRLPGPFWPRSYGHKQERSRRCVPASFRERWGP